MKFKSDIEVQAGLKDSSGLAGTSGQILSSTASGVSWIDQISLNGYVPYTGATTDVNLGTHTLLASDLVVSHSTGSGVAATITKGGNGEALTVIKTSGSGNAMSVAGGLTSLVDLTLSSIANATTDTDKFIVSDGGLIKYRTGAQVLSDIGAVSSANNGLSLNGTIAQLGGTLLQSTLIDGGAATAYNLTFTNGDLVITNGAGTGGLRGNIVLSNNRQIFWGSSGSGSYIGADAVSGNFVYRTLTTGKQVFYASMQFINYGSGTKTGTAAYNLAVTSAGDIIETAMSPVIPTFTSGSVIFSNGTTLAQDNANFFWDDTNNRLGIGTTIPTTALDVNGVITATGGNSTSWNAKQNALVSGTNIRTVNGQSLVGPGNVSVLFAHGLVPVPTASSLSYSQSINGGGFSVIGGTANRMYLAPFIPSKGFNSISMSINVTSVVAGALIRLLLYSDVNGKPSSKIWESTSLDAGSITGLKTATLSATFAAGATYWIGVQSSSTAGTYALQANQLIPLYNSNGSQTISSYYLTAAIGSAPATITSGLTGYSGSIPMAVINV